MKNYKNESMVDVAYEVLKKTEGQLNFKELFDEVCNLQEVSEDQKMDIISPFFTNISLDGRFVLLKNNFWDLRERQTFENISSDMNNMYDENSLDLDYSDEEISEEDRILSGEIDEDEEENESEDYENSDGYND